MNATDKATVSITEIVELLKKEIKTYGWTPVSVRTEYGYVRMKFTGIGSIPDRFETVAIVSVKEPFYFDIPGILNTRYVANDGSHAFRFLPVEYTK